MRILVIPRLVARSLLLLSCLALIIPGFGATYLYYAGSEVPSGSLACLEQDKTEPDSVTQSLDPEVIATVAAIKSASSPQRNSRDSESRSDSIVSILPNRTASLVQNDNLTFEEENISDEASSNQTDEAQKIERVVEPETPLLSALPLVDISKVSFDIEANGDLALEFEIRNLARSEISGSTWAVATFISEDGSRIHIPTHPRIVSDRVTAAENQKNGISFRAKALTVKQFRFEPPRDIDGVFKSVTIVALPSREQASPNQLSTDLRGAPVPAIRSIRVSER